MSVEKTVHVADPTNPLGHQVGFFKSFIDRAFTFCPTPTQKLEKTTSHMTATDDRHFEDIGIDHADAVVLCIPPRRSKGTYRKALGG